MTYRADVVPGRSCTGCTLCCKLLGIEEVGVPPLIWCPHCAIGNGCGIYVDRPTECRQFFCEYLLDAELGEHWMPSRCNMVVTLEEHPRSLVIHVNPEWPHAWRQEPFLSDVRRWARAGAREGWRVIVWEGETKIVVGPAADAEDRDVAVA